MKDKSFRTKLLVDMLKRVYNDTKVNSETIININLSEMDNVLIIAPHADDEVIGCGGLISHLVTKKKKITILIITQESTRSISKRVENSVSIRISESYAAKQKLGYNDLIYFNFPELELSNESELSKQFIYKLNSIIDDVQPQNIFIPNMNERHPDHRFIGNRSLELIKNKIKNKELSQIVQLFIYEVWGPINMNSYFLFPKNIMKSKIDAMRCYQTQLESVDYLSILKFINSYRGRIVQDILDIKKEVYAEAFEIININSLIFEH